MLTIQIISKEVEFVFITKSIYFKKKPYILKEALLLEMSYNNKKVIVSFIYRSPSTDEFDSFLSNFENFLNGINKRKPSLSVVTGDLIQD